MLAVLYGAASSRQGRQHGGIVAQRRGEYEAVPDRVLETQASPYVEYHTDRIKAPPRAMSQSVTGAKAAAIGSITKRPLHPIAR